MGDLYSLCSYWLLSGTTFFVCCFCVYLLLAQKSKARESIIGYMQDKPALSAILFSLCLLICVFSNRSFYRWIGCDDIRTMPAGEYCYYVEVNREYGNTYTLPAKIEVSKNGYTVTDSDGNEHTRTYSAYRLITVYFNNGGFLRVDGEEFELDESFSFIDQDDEYWECRFVNERCYEAPFDETNPINEWDTVRLVFCAVVLLLTYTSLQLSIREAAKETHSPYNATGWIWGLAVLAVGALTVILCLPHNTTPKNTYEENTPLASTTTTTQRNNNLFNNGELIW